MAASQYGLGAAGLTGFGLDQKQDAMETLGKVADQEQERNIANKQIKAQTKAGNVQLGAMGGAMAGFAVGGPIGGMIGGVLGAVGGGLFSMVMAVLMVVALASPATSEASMLTQLNLHQSLNYEPQTGEFFWIESPTQRIKAGSRAGFEKKGDGYRYIKIGGRAYGEHRLAWLYMTGAWPSEEIDHTNRVRSDNRFENLRQVNRKQNCENRKPRAGSAANFRGVSWSNGRWHATIMHFGKQMCLGYFDSIDEAKKARLDAEARLFTHSNREV